MTRTTARRPWIKIYPIDCLDGSIRYQLEADERGVWYDILNFSAICAIPGTISDKDKRPYPHSFIANRLNIPLELLEKTLKKCKEEGRINEDGYGIHITNWNEYQSEYQRQKKYRDRKKEGKKTHKRCRVCSYKGLTSEDYCPECEAPLEPDYPDGKYGRFTQH